MLELLVYLLAALAAWVALAALGGGVVSVIVAPLVTVRAAMRRMREWTAPARARRELARLGAEGWTGDGEEAMRRGDGVEVRLWAGDGGLVRETSLPGPPAWLRVDPGPYPRCFFGPWPVPIEILPDPVPHRFFSTGGWIQGGRVGRTASGEATGPEADLGDLEAVRAWAVPLYTPLDELAKGPGLARPEDRLAVVALLAARPWSPGPGWPAGAEGTVDRLRRDPSAEVRLAVAVHERDDEGVLAAARFGAPTAGQAPAVARALTVLRGWGRPWEDHAVGLARRMPDPTPALDVLVAHGETERALDGLAAWAAEGGPGSEAAARAAGALRRRSGREQGGELSLRDDRTGALSVPADRRGEVVLVDPRPRGS